MVKACEKPSNSNFLYPDKYSIKEKIETVAKEIYRADGVSYTPEAEAKIKLFTEMGLSHLPLCMAKTHLSFSHNPLLKGAPRGWTLPITDVRASVGAGFIFPLCGTMRTMPGLPTRPAFTDVDLEDEARAKLGQLGQAILHYERARRMDPTDPEIRANLEAKYHLDEPLLVQYFRYLGEIVAFDFGPSFHYLDQSVNELIGRGFPVSATIGGLAILLAFFAGILIGVTAALRQNTAVDYSVMGVAMLGISVPNFVIAPLLILGLAIYGGWLPASGWDWTWQSAVLPVITLALPVIAYIARLMRGSMIEVLRSNFIRTARAQGLSTMTIVLRHALKPALLPVVSYLGPATAAVITGSVVIEQIFGVPGLGRFFVQGALNRDYTLVMGVVIFYGVLIILLNFLVDLVYAWLDPKVRYDKRS